jgi:eukaryotic-like serine/threonine-protein kinase
LLVSFRVTELAPGTEITKNVKLLRMLARGGAGTVWVGQHQLLKMAVAVKLISKEISGYEARARFTREALTAARLKSPHVVRIFDHGTTPAGAPFIVMELCQGEDLGCRLKRSGHLRKSETKTIVKQLCAALTEAHGQGLVHRDIKPGNVFLEYGDDGQPFVRLLDFGLAKQLGADAMMQTATGMVIGTPNYMSPEQAFDASRADHRADLWAVAAVAYHCLTGQRPFRADSYGALFVALARGKFEQPSNLRRDLGPSVDAFFERAFHPDPRQRYQSARELRDAFLNGEVPAPARVAAKRASALGVWLVLACVALMGAIFASAFLLMAFQAGLHHVITEKTQSWFGP